MKKPQLYYHAPVDGAEEPLQPPKVAGEDRLEVPPAVSPKATGEAFAVTLSGEPTAPSLEPHEREPGYSGALEPRLWTPERVIEAVYDLDRALAQTLLKIISSGTATAKHYDVARQYLKDRGWNLDKLAQSERMEDDAVNLTDLDLDLDFKDDDFGNA